MYRNTDIPDLKEDFRGLVKDIKSIMTEARADCARALNKSILQANWRRGQRIVEELQNGERRAKYGSNLIATISKVLTFELGKGYGERSIRNYRQFYLDFQDIEIWHARVPNLTWTHFKSVLRVENKEARDWYLTEASKYLTYLPSEAELLREIDIQKEFYLLQHPESR